MNSFDYTLNHIRAHLDALLEGREFSEWSPVIGGWARWYMTVEQGGR